jgi:hypothetical protein
MKALPKKLLPLILLGIAVTSLFSVQPAQAFTITLEQMGADVVANGSGAFNLTGLTFSNIGGFNAGITASTAFIITGNGANLDFYTGFTGPTSFGSGSGVFASIFSGDGVGIAGLGGSIFVPLGYVSNTALSSSATWNSATFASLGVTPGTYVWTWGAGGANQNFTLIIGGAGVPDGGSTVSLLGCALLGLAALRRKLGC